FGDRRIQGNAYGFGSGAAGVDEALVQARETHQLCRGKHGQHDRRYAGAFGKRSEGHTRSRVRAGQARVIGGGNLMSTFDAGSREDTFAFVLADFAGETVAFIDIETFDSLAPAHSASRLSRKRTPRDPGSHR